MPRHRLPLRLSSCSHHNLHPHHASSTATQRLPQLRLFSSSTLSPARLPASPLLCAASPALARCSRRSRSCVNPPSPPALPLRRHVQSHVDQLRAGALFEQSGKVYRVVGHEVHMRGRAHTTITLECRDEAGNKTSLRLRPSDKVELVQLDTEELTYLYRDDHTLHLMHPTSFEPIELPVTALAPDQLPFLADNTPVKATKRGAAYLGVTLPERAVGRVARAEGVKSGKVGLNDGKGRVVVLENGVEVFDCPNSVEVGDTIAVSTQTLRFMQKVD